MIKAASLGIDTSLRRFSQFLQGHGIPHRINEESGRQIIWVDNQEEAEFVQQALGAWRFEEISQTELSSTRSFDVAGTVRKTARLTRRAFTVSPVSFSLIVGCLLVALVSEMGEHAERVAFLYYPVVATSNVFALLADLARIDFLLRSFTPMLLHFGELHLVFNMLWLAYFGRQLEPIHPRWIFVLLILFTSFAGNTTQYLYSNYNNFGGMSGVVYGLLGYTWVIHTFMPRSRLLLGNGMFVMFVLALIAMEIVASSWIASAAHVGGLLAGLLLGVLMVVYYRLLLHRDAISKD